MANRMTMIINSVLRNYPPFAYLLIFFILSIASSCQYSEEHVAVNVNNEFSITLPSWLKEEEGLKPGAALQYANRYRNFYIIGETEPNTGGDISSLTARYLGVLRSSMNDAVMTDSSAFNHREQKAIRIEVYGKMNGESIYFSELVVEGKGKFYHLSIWTRGEDRKLKYKEEINNILLSFREI